MKVFFQNQQMPPGGQKGRPFAPTQLRSAKTLRYAVGRIERRLETYVRRLTWFSMVMENALAMTAGPEAFSADLPDRLCTWCKVAMKKRLVASGQFIHYTCPKCIFQHTLRLGGRPLAPGSKH